jgi:hypothetical protein
MKCKVVRILDNIFIDLNEIYKRKFKIETLATGRRRPCPCPAVVAEPPIPCR